MPIKQPEVLSRADFDQAVVRLRLNISEISKEVGIPRTYLSEFRNGDRTLRPENLAKLRDYFSSKGIEFDEPLDPAPTLRGTVKEVRYIWPVADGVSDAALARAQELIDENHERLTVLMKQVAERNNGFLGDGEFSPQSKAALQEAGTLMAENYALLRGLRGWPGLGAGATGESVEKVGDILIETFRARFEAAGLIEPKPVPNEGDDGQEREAA